MNPSEEIQEGGNITPSSPISATIVKTPTGVFETQEHNSFPYSHPLEPTGPVVVTDPNGAENLYAGSSPIVPPPPPADPGATVVAPPKPRRSRQPRSTTPPPAPPAAPAVSAAPAVPVVVNSTIQQSTQPPSGLLGILMMLMGRDNKKKKSGNLQHLIETKLETPVFFIVTFTMVIRAAQLFSGGTLIMSAVLGKAYPAFEIVTGLGLGIGSEMLMTIAGRTWRRCANEAAELPGRPGLSKVARQALIIKEKQSATYSRRVMFVGMAASLYAGISYLFTNSGQSLSLALFTNPAFYSDLVACAVVTTTVFYLGVLKEGRAITDAEEAIAEIDEGMNEAVKAAIKRFTAGLQTPVDEKLIAENISPSKKAKFLRAVAKINKGKVWTSKELRNRLGVGNDATLIRKLNRRINELARDPENALEKAPDNKTWLVPVAIIWDEWGDAIAEHDAMLLVQKQTPQLATAV